MFINKILKKYAYFIGRVGDWRKHFDEEINKRLDEFIRLQLEGTNLSFDYVPPDDESVKR